MRGTKCAHCGTRPRAPLLPTDADLTQARTKLHAQLRRAADLDRDALVRLKDWETEFRTKIDRGAYCRPCLQTWVWSLPTHPPPEKE